MLGDVIKSQIKSEVNERRKGVHFCENCGASVIKSSGHCPKCGKLLERGTMPSYQSKPQNQEMVVTTGGRESSPHDRRAMLSVLGLLALLVFTIGLGVFVPKYSSLYIFGYIMIISYAVSGPLRKNRQWSDLGIKRGFVKDFKKVWYYFAIDAIVFQLVPPVLGVAYLFGYYPQLLHHITGRVATDFGGPLALNATLLIILALTAVLTLMEEVVFRVTIQQRLSWFIGAPAAIAVATAVFGLAHAVGAAGLLPIITLDVAGVMLDGIFFGVIFAKTKNLAVTWVTHYMADVIGIIALLTVRSNPIAQDQRMNRADSTS